MSTGVGGTALPVSADIAQGQSFTCQINPSNGYAVDTITIGSSSSVNNGTSEPPEHSCFRTITITNVQSDVNISITFDYCTDDTGVPDKYKLQVNATAGPGGSVSPENQNVIHGEDAIINIVPDENMAVDTITANDETYVNDGE